jgi:hypothetical protein
MGSYIRIRLLLKVKFLILNVMKKLFFAFILILSINMSKAQVADHAIGLRLGGGNGFGTEISYQQGLGALNRLEFDLGIQSPPNANAWGLAGLYQWVWKIDDGFNWYAGVGGRIGSWSYNNDYVGSNRGGTFLAAAGDIGIEYAFPVGIQLSLDARPAINLINSGDSFNSNIAFGIRYQF